MQESQVFEYKPPDDNPLRGWIPRKKPEFKNRVCIDCGKVIEHVTGANQKRCPDCRVLKEHEWNTKRRKKPEPLGNTDLGEKLADTWEHEANLVKREKRRQMGRY